MHQTGNHFDGFDVRLNTLQYPSTLSWVEPVSLNWHAVCPSQPEMWWKPTIFCRWAWTLCADNEGTRLDENLGVDNSAVCNAHSNRSSKWEQLVSCAGACPAQGAQLRATQGVAKFQRRKTTTTTTKQQQKNKCYWQTNLTETNELFGDQKRGLGPSIRLSGSVRHSTCLIMKHQRNLIKWKNDQL